MVLMVVFKGVYRCVMVALVGKLREFYGCVTVVHLKHALVHRIWTTHFSILIRSSPISRSFIHSKLDGLWNVRCYKYFGNDLIFLAWWVCCSLFCIRDFETFGFLDEVSLDEIRCIVFR